MQSWSTMLHWRVWKDLPKIYSRSCATIRQFWPRPWRGLFRPSIPKKQIQLQNPNEKPTDKRYEGAFFACDRHGHKKTDSIPTTKSVEVVGCYRHRIFSSWLWYRLLSSVGVVGWYQLLLVGCRQFIGRVAENNLLGEGTGWKMKIMKEVKD